MQGERILKSLLNGQTGGLYEDTKNYLASLQRPLKNKNGCQAGGKATEETVSKYAVFCTKFLRCAIETLKNVKAKGNDVIEVTDALKLVGTPLNNTLSLHHGNYLKFIPSVDQLAKTLYLLTLLLLSSLPRHSLKGLWIMLMTSINSSSFLRHGRGMTRKLDHFVYVHLICYFKELGSLRRQKNLQGNDHHTCVLC
ncbi:unnamed protein product [Porites lobata]|uniref:Uncharacterized protein n=1 Tax=Porites lobata TaxID=104759 RepID=A0ABN8RSN5_9CNID|nr:unnamed protein product [Porites lobata]